MAKILGGDEGDWVDDWLGRRHRGDHSRTLRIVRETLARMDRRQSASSWVAPDLAPEPDDGSLVHVLAAAILRQEIEDAERRLAEG